MHAFQNNEGSRKELDGEGDGVGPQVVGDGPNDKGRKKVDAEVDPNEEIGHKDGRQEFGVDAFQDLAQGNQNVCELMNEKNEETDVEVTGLEGRKKQQNSRDVMPSHEDTVNPSPLGPNHLEIIHTPLIDLEDVEEVQKKVLPKGDGSNHPPQIPLDVEKDVDEKGVEEVDTTPEGHRRHFPIGFGGFVLDEGTEPIPQKTPSHNDTKEINP